MEKLSHESQDRIHFSCFFSCQTLQGDILVLRDRTFSSQDYLVSFPRFRNSWRWFQSWCFCDCFFFFCNFCNFFFSSIEIFTHSKILLPPRSCLEPLCNRLFHEVIQLQWSIGCTQQERFPFDLGFKLPCWGLTLFLLLNTLWWFSGNNLGLHPDIWLIIFIFIAFIITDQHLKLRSRFRFLVKFRFRFLPRFNSIHFVIWFLEYSIIFWSGIIFGKEHQREKDQFLYLSNFPKFSAWSSLIQRNNENDKEIVSLY